ncbi:hypothetical protein HU200_029100 [Digitaria exilis]|uniref:RING-type domain-containing protein n=1 Tax=Digitaria exilis TaxID=1010633 RepID=A0A835BTC4_9POAL|nr:hypothetical protein HU200_029100 [Digitaria exilis]
MADGGDNMAAHATAGGIARPPPSGQQRLHRLYQELHHLQHLAPGLDERVRRGMIEERQDQLDLVFEELGFFDRRAVVETGGGGGASAVAVAGLEKQTSTPQATPPAAASAGRSDGEEVSVMPCFHGHGFQQDCIAKWLWWSNKCPLCRHQLPTGMHG